MLKPLETLTWCGRRAAAIGTVGQPEPKLKYFMIEKTTKKQERSLLSGHIDEEAGLAGLDPLQALTFYKRWHRQKSELLLQCTDAFLGKQN